MYIWWSTNGTKLNFMLLRLFPLFLARSFILLDITHIHYYAVSKCEQGRNCAKRDEKSNIFFLLPLAKGIWIKQTIFGAFRPSIKILLLSLINTAFTHLSVVETHLAIIFLSSPEKKLSHSKWYWLSYSPREKWTFQNYPAHYNYCHSWRLWSRKPKWLISPSSKSV